MLCLLPLGGLQWRRLRFALRILRRLVARHLALSQDVPVGDSNKLLTSRSSLQHRRRRSCLSLYRRGYILSLLLPLHPERQILWMAP